MCKWLITQAPLDSLISDILQLMRDEQYGTEVLPKVYEFFDCRLCDKWKLSEDQKVTRYSATITTMDLSDAGISGECLTKEFHVFCAINKHQPSFIPKSDGIFEESVLSIYVKERSVGIKFVITLRGPKATSVFEPSVLQELHRLAPFLILGLGNSETFTFIDNDYQSSLVERDSFAALLEVTEVLSSEVGSKELTDLIMEKG